MKLPKNISHNISSSLLTAGLAVATSAGFGRGDSAFVSPAVESIPK
jgi:hypothetical protein